MVQMSSTIRTFLFRDIFLETLDVESSSLATEGFGKFLMTWAPWLGVTL